jgi:hypothetical protein
MKKNLSLLILFTVIYLSGCKGINKNNYDLLNEILSTINAESGNIFFTEDLMTKTSSKKYYIEFIVNNCEMIENGGADPKLVASFVASELFKKLDKKSLEKNYGYEIVINEKNKEPHKFFYEKEKVKLAVKGMKTIEEYVEFIKKDKISKANSFLDLTKTDYVDSDFSIQIKDKIGNDYTKTFTLYSEYNDISENDSWIYVTFLIKKDNSFINLKTIINKSNYEKIVYTRGSFTNQSYKG